ncbi:MAG: hypothetical protein GEU75_08815 [Dehalococcoidia bacterium]|nr:hypothetical protein [Dehalococcoidia bacterium]
MEEDDPSPKASVSQQRRIDNRKAMAWIGIASDPEPDAARRHDELFVEALLGKGDEPDLTSSPPGVG